MGEGGPEPCHRMSSSSWATTSGGVTSAATAAWRPRHASTPWPRRGCGFKNYNVEAQCTPTRSAVLTGRLPIRTGNCSVPLPGQGHYGLAPWEYTLGELFADAGYATAAFGKWHVGDIAGRVPTDQGFDEWFGIKNTSDESGYSSYPLFAESGVRCRRSGKGSDGSPVTPVADFDLATRPLLDEQIAARPPPSSSGTRKPARPSSRTSASPRCTRP